jgi:hypothetical protein
MGYHILFIIIQRDPFVIVRLDLFIIVPLDLFVIVRLAVVLSYMSKGPDNPAF